MSKAGPVAPEGAMAEVRTAAAVATAAAADVRTDEAAVPAGAAPERETTDEVRKRLRWMWQQKEGAAAVD